MNHLKLLILTAFLISFLAVPTYPQTDMTEEPVGSEGLPEGMSQEMLMEAFLSSLDFRKGTVGLGDNLVTLNLPESYSYLPPEDADKILVDLWGNPPGTETMGMIVPDNVSVFDANAWVVVIGYEEDGYVSDEDAENIDYNELLGEMKAAAEDDNKMRVEQGYESIEFVGWAAAPFYDKEANKLHWAKEIRFGESDIHTLNYNIRILGRKGVLLLNIVAGMPQLQTISSEIPSLLAMTEFNPGNTYSDFNPGIDKVAAYGMGALVAGKIASKVGILAKFSGVLLALKKLWILLAVGVVAFFKALFGKKKSTQPTDTE